MILPSVGLIRKVADQCLLLAERCLAHNKFDREPFDVKAV
jgi:hypothetical protein